MNSNNGICFKPIIDIESGVESLKRVNHLIHELTKRNYLAKQKENWNIVSYTRNNIEDAKDMKHEIIEDTKAIIHQKFKPIKICQ